MWRSGARRVEHLSRRSPRELSACRRREPILSRNARRLTGYQDNALHSKTEYRLLSTQSKDSTQRSRDPGRSTLKRDSRRTIRPTTHSGKGHEAQPAPRQSAQAPLTIAEAFEKTCSFHHRLSRAESLPPVWSTAKIVHSHKHRQAVFRDTQALLDRIVSAVNKGHLNPAGKHGRDLSRLTIEILNLYSQIPPHDGTSIYQAGRKVLALLDEWNLQLQPLHYASVVEAAVRESNWKAAADLFWERIDPDASGQTPMKVSRHLAVGLYATARNAQNEGGAVADQVMDAVLRMSMVCPTNQDDYVQTAGTALGHAGEWKSFVTYLENSYNSSRLGQPLIAAVIRSCILCNRADDALGLFDELVSGPMLSGGDWQYGGEYHALNPLCRDLAMRALGSSTSANVAERALELYRQVKKEEVQISVDALCGVVKACERDGKWKEAVEVFAEFLDHYRDPHWLVDGDALKIVPIEETERDEDSPTPVDSMKQSLPQIGDALASVMRSCNAAGKFGMALLLCRLLDEALPKSLSVYHSHTGSWGASVKDSNELVQTLAPVMFRFENTEDILVAAMVSLCGLECSRRGEQLCIVAGAMMDDLVEDGIPAQEWFNARECYKYAQSLASKSQVLPTSWESAHRHMCRLIGACALIKMNNQELTDNQRKILSSALGKAMRSCTGTGQPETGLFLAKRMEGILVPKVERTYSVRGAMAKFLGFEDPEPGTDPMFSDSVLLAEAVNAYRAMGSPDEALELLTMLPESFGIGNTSANQKVAPANDTQWTPAINAAIRLLSDENRIDVAKMLLHEMDDGVLRNQDTFTSMAEALAKEEQWTEIIKIFMRASQSRLLTESLAFSAMKALLESNQEKLLPQLRLITKDASRQFGLGEKEWLESCFWFLERRLGNTARLLMWWNDPATSKDMKLQLAIDQFATRRETGLSPKNDVLRYLTVRAREHKSSSTGTPFSKEDWLVLLRNVLLEAESSLLWNMPKFVEDACLALLSLGAKRECVEFARDAVARGVRITSNTATAASEAAHAESLQANELSLLSNYHA